MYYQYTGFPLFIDTNYQIQLSSFEVAISPDMLFYSSETTLYLLLLLLLLLFFVLFLFCFVLFCFLFVCLFVLALTDILFINFAFNMTPNKTELKTPELYSRGAGKSLITH